MKPDMTIWFNGQLKPANEVQVPILAHALHYGSSVFEGIRCYATPDGPAVFRLADHVDRLFDSASIYRMQLKHGREELASACKDTVRANGLRSAYLRPIALRGVCGLGVAAPEDGPVDVAIIAMEWGAYLGEEGLKHGIDVCVSSWNRAAQNTFPAAAKAGGNYLNSQLVKMEANLDGYDEGIVLGSDGLVSEGSGENLFAIKNGTVYTPSSVHSILPGITRHTAIELMRELGIRVVQRGIPREYLYIADELFFTGTAAEITPIRAVDKIQIGSGKRGPITEKVQKAFFEVVNAEREDRLKWLSFV